MGATGDTPRLIVVVDLDYAGSAGRWLHLLRETAAAARSAPVAVQVRAKDRPPGEFESLAAQAREAVPGDVLLVLNGDAALAERLGYGGVHWPEAAIPAAPPAPGVAGGSLAWRSAAVHSPAAVRRAERAGATALVFGSVFEPGSKRGDAAGLEALRVVAESTTLPVYAIGGVTPERAGACVEAGAAGVAAVSGVLGAASVAEAVESYVTALGAAPGAEAACR